MAVVVQDELGQVALLLVDTLHEVGKLLRGGEAPCHKRHVFNVNPKAGSVSLHTFAARPLGEWNSLECTQSTWNMAICWHKAWSFCKLAWIAANRKQIGTDKSRPSKSFSGMKSSMT